MLDGPFLREPLSHSLWLTTSQHNLVVDFYEPMLREATTYDRGVGYFSSGWLRVNAQGMREFAEHDGVARWVTSPILSQQDWDAMLAGEKARRDEALRESLMLSIDMLEAELESKTLDALVWLMADGVIEFRLAVPRNKLSGGDYHEKFGVFADGAGRRVAYIGSYNDSIKGLRNSESIMVLPGWNGDFASAVEEQVQRFERLWNDEDENVGVYELPDAAKKRLLRLRQYERPYALGPKRKAEVAEEEAETYSSRKPELPDWLELRGYQQEAIEEWEKTSRGLLEMATGTGKTITALAAAVRLYERMGRLALVVAAPLTHLVEQWAREARQFGFNPVIAGGSRERWLEQLADQATEYRNGWRNELCVVVTHKTLCSDHFLEVVSRLGPDVLIVGDEAHHLGAKKTVARLPEQVQNRLALSATPDRWYDEDGTDGLHQYFGETVFRFPLERAIDEGFLTPYSYHPHLVELTDDELDEYRVLSAKIARAIARGDGDDEAVTALLSQRATLLNNAQHKLEVLARLLECDGCDIRAMAFALFYCAPRRHRDEDGQLEHVLHMLGVERGVRVDSLTSREGLVERTRILQRFQSGELQAIAAINCLDEGVDVPATQVAYILASAGTPRQFIQRRGRILRRAPGKERAAIHDLLVVPPESAGSGTERSIVRRELQRFKEFADAAVNKYEAYEQIWPLLEAHGMRDL